MKTLALPALLLALSPLAALAADPSPACAAKRTSIETRITEATARGNKREVAGLEKALKANQAGCTDASLARERERDIKQARQKVAEREKGLREAERKGDAKKIEDRKAKLEEARNGLAEAEKPLPQ